MNDTTPRRSRGEALAPDTITALRAAMEKRPAESIAVAARVSLATVRKAVAGKPVMRVTADAIARVIGCETAQAA